MEEVRNNLNPVSSFQWNKEFEIEKKRNVRDPISYIMLCSKLTIENK